MKQEPLVSVIIVTRNEEENIARCLASIFDQSFPRDKMEVIVVDNFSDDSTAKIASFFPVRFYQKGPERNVQRPFGAAKARGKYLLFVDADMFLSKDLIKEAVALAERGLDALILPEKAGGRGFLARCQKLEKRCYWGDEDVEVANRFIKKSVYEKVGGYDSSLIAAEDFDLGDRIKTSGYKIGRTKSLITHFEKTGFWLSVKKKYYYGSKMWPYFKKNGMAGVKKFYPFRKAFFRHLNLFLQEPFCGLVLVSLKISQWIAGTAGFLLSFIKKNRD